MSLTRCLRIHRKALTEAGVDTSAIREVSRLYAETDGMATDAAEKAAVDDALADVQASIDAATAYIRKKGGEVSQAKAEKPTPKAEETPKVGPTKDAEPRPGVIRTLDEDGRASDGGPILPGDRFRTSSGRTTTPYPKQKKERYASQWLIDNAVAEAESRRDDFNAPTFRAATILKSGDLAPADRDGMLMYLFGEQPKVLPPITRDLRPSQPRPGAKDVKESRSRKRQSRAAKADVVAAVKQVVEQMAPAARVDVVHRLLSQKDGETTVSGIQFLDYIAVSLDGGVPAARHEVIHFLKEAGLFTPQEWSILERNADKWMDKHEIRETYPDLADRPLAMKEEAVAEEFANPGDAKHTPFVQRMFERIREFFERVTNALRGLGYQSASDIFEKVESGEVGRRQTPAQAARAKRGEIKESRKKKPTNPDLARVQAAAKAKMEREQKEGKPHEEQAQGSLHAAEMATLPASAQRTPNPSAKALAVSQALPFTPFHTPPHIKKVLEDRTVSHLSRVKRSLPLAEDVLRYQLQDRYIYTRRLQEQVQDREGGPLPEAIDGYVWLRLFPGKAGHDLVKLDQNVIEPLIERMNELDVTIDELDLYLYARWAPRANELVAAINQRYPDGGSGMKNADAKAIIDGYRAAGKEVDLQELAEHVYKMNMSRLELLYRHGIIPKAQYAAWKADREYVPLRGFEDDAVAEFIEKGKPKKGTGTGRGHDIRFKEVARLGRDTRARLILGTTVWQAQRAIVVSHKNDATKALYKFAQKYPDPAVWETNAAKTRLVKSKKTGMVQVIPDQQYVQRDNVIGVMIDGKQHFLTIHHPHIAPALKNMGAQEIQWVARLAQWANRFFAFIYTSASPNFIMTNAFRDFEEGLVNMQEFDVKGLAKDVARDWIGLRRRGIIFTADFKALRAGYKAIKGKTSTDPDVQAFIDSFNEYWKAGGKVEFFSMRDMERQHKRLANMMADVNPSNIRKIRLFATNVVKLISDINGAVENHVRFLTYHHLRKRGFSEQAAAFLVRNLTVDFNLKGMAGPYISAFYLFYNASIQSMARLGHAVIRPKPPQNYLAGAPGNPRSDKKIRIKMRTILGSIILSGLANDLLNGLFLSAEQTVGYDDDDDKKKDRKKLWDQIPENYKQRYMIWGNPYAKDKPGKPYGPGFMMPHGYSFFHRMGMLVGEVLRGATPPGEAAMTLMGAFFTSFNPLGSHDQPWMVLIPQIFKAPVELGLNVDWTGKPIAPQENVFQPWKPNVDRYWGSVSEPAKGIANFLYQGGDADRFEPAIVDISPEHIDYIWNMFTGGLGTFLSRTSSGIYDFATKNEVDIKDVPFVGQLSMSQSAAWEFDKYSQIRNRVMAYRDVKRDMGDFAKEDAYAKKHPVEEELLGNVMAAEKFRKKISKGSSAIRNDQDLTEKQKEDKLWGTDKDPGPDRRKLEVMRKVIRKWEDLEKLR